MDGREGVLIILLNYKNWQDTIECLDSLRKLQSVPFHILLIDNGSQDSSVAEICGWASGKFNMSTVPGNRNPADIARQCILPETKVREDIEPVLIIVENQENAGFAAGCNQGIQIALSAGMEYVWLLNNDTVVEPSSLCKLVSFLDNNPSCQAVTPQIRYYNKPSVIWNCGGELKWYGARTYYLLNHSAEQLSGKDSLDVTFVTGCSLLLRSSLLEKHGGLSEKFFFGEEDFEFCLRMKKNNIRMSCCLGALIYHKVSASVDNASSKFLNKVYVHYVNRFINLRDYWPRLFWLFWRLCYCIFIYDLLGRKYNISRRDKVAFIRRLRLDSSLLPGVDRERFFAIMNDVDYISKR
jgi:GT2 family glycosyltransferase